MQYSFDQYDHSIAHGNLKGKEPFTRMKLSAIKLLKDSVHAKAPRKALREVENLRGGVLNARSSCDLPHDQRQVDNLKHAVTAKLETSSSYQHDILAHVMQMCKDSSNSDTICLVC